MVHLRQDSHGTHDWLLDGVSVTQGGRSCCCVCVVHLGFRVTAPGGAGPQPSRLVGEVGRSRPNSLIGSAKTILRRTHPDRWRRPRHGVGQRSGFIDFRGCGCGCVRTASCGRRLQKQRTNFIASPDAARRVLAEDLIHGDSPSTSANQHHAGLDPVAPARSDTARSTAARLRPAFAGGGTMTRTGAPTRPRARRRPRYFFPRPREPPRMPPVIIHTIAPTMSMQGIRNRR